MNKNLFSLFLLFYFIGQAKTEYNSETIKELTPKSIIFGEFDYFSYKIFEYTNFCHENSESNLINVNFQIFTKANYDSHIYLYDNFSSISQDGNGNFVNYISDQEYKDSKVNYIFENLNCEKDYYFIFSVIMKERSPLYYLYFKYYQFLIINTETNIINLSPLISDYYSIFPRSNSKIENMIYSFEEDKLVLIEFKSGNIEINENDRNIYKIIRMNIFQNYLNLKNGTFIILTINLQIQLIFSIFIQIILTL